MKRIRRQGEAPPLAIEATDQTEAKEVRLFAIGTGQSGKLKTEGFFRAKNCRYLFTFFANCAIMFKKPSVASEKAERFYEMYLLRF